MTMSSMIVCARCREEHAHHSRGLCRLCYAYAHRQGLLADYPLVRKPWTDPMGIICARCGKKRTHHGRGLCKPLLRIRVPEGVCWRIIRV